MFKQTLHLKGKHLNRYTDKDNEDWFTVDDICTILDCTESEILKRINAYLKHNGDRAKVSGELFINRVTLVEFLNYLSVSTIFEVLIRLKLLADPSDNLNPKPQQLTSVKKNINNLFSRQETAELCGVLPTRLSYLDRTGVVVPLKVGNPVKPSCLYSWVQILTIRAIALLRDSAELKEIKAFSEFVQSNLADDQLDKEIIIYNAVANWYDPLVLENEVERFFAKVKSVSGTYDRLRIVKFPPLNFVVNEVMEAAKCSKRRGLKSIEKRLGE